jgi:hypothetical protein
VSAHSMRSTGLATVVLMTTTASLQAQPDQYLCVSEHSAGVHYSQQTTLTAARGVVVGQFGRP